MNLTGVHHRPAPPALTGCMGLSSTERITLMALASISMVGLFVVGLSLTISSTFSATSYAHRVTGIVLTTLSALLGLPSLLFASRKLNQLYRRQEGRPVLAPPTLKVYLFALSSLCALVILALGVTLFSIKVTRYPASSSLSSQVAKYFPILVVSALPMGGMICYTIDNIDTLFEDDKLSLKTRHEQEEQRIRRMNLAELCLKQGGLSEEDINDRENLRVHVMTRYNQIKQQLRLGDQNQILDVEENRPLKEQLIWLEESFKSLTGEDLNPE